jgi:hypothetical protein
MSGLAWRSGDRVWIDGGKGDGVREFDSARVHLVLPGEEPSVFSPGVKAGLVVLGLAVSAVGFLAFLSQHPPGISHF